MYKVPFQINFKRHISIIHTVDKNIIAITKIQNNYGAIQSFIFQLLRYCSL